MGCYQELPTVTMCYMKQINLRLPEELLVQVDARRGDIPRERWLRTLVEAELNGPPPVDDPVDLLERGRILAAQRDAERPSQPKPQPAPNPPQTPPPPPKPIVETSAHREFLEQRGPVPYPLLDHVWVGSGATCMRLGCHAPKDRAAHA